MEISILLSVFKEFREWISGIDKSNLEQNKEEKSALKSIYLALTETKFYFADRKNMPQDRERERQISKLWFDASIELKSIDIDLAQRCFLKGDFWTDPSNWRENDGNNINISIDEMTKLSRKLLMS